MIKDNLKTYKNDTVVSISRRIVSFLIDSMIFIVTAFLILILCMNILQKVEAYAKYERTVNEEMNECYKIEEEAHIYEFIDNKYSSPRKMEEIFEDYCLSHILYSYSKDKVPFEKYNVSIKNDKNLEAANYNNDKLAYFYINYVPKFNENNNIVNMDENPKLFFYKEFKAASVKNDIWVYDEENYELPYLDAYFAIDLYKYLFEDDKYQAGLTNYNYLIVSYKKLWNKEVDQLINSDRFKSHYDVYKKNYAICSYIVDLLCFVVYILTFFLVILLPQIIFKKMKTFGKKIMKISVIDDERFDCILRQRILKNVLLFFALFGLMIPVCFFAGGLSSGWMYPFFTINGVGFSLFSLMVIAFATSFVSFCFSAFRKDKKSIHDIFVNTLCVDDRYHLEKEESNSIIEKEEQKQFKESQGEIPQKEYFDSSCFNNSERNTKDSD